MATELVPESRPTRKSAFGKPVIAELNVGRACSLSSRQEFPRTSCAKSTISRAEQSEPPIRYGAWLAEQETVRATQNDASVARFSLTMSLPRAVGRVLTRQGMRLLTARDVGLRGAPDDEV